jgi:GNAT superfamily N-acetyltransferase
LKVHNIHERELAASPQQVGAPIDSLSSRNDALWPRQCWPRMAAVLSSAARRLARRRAGRGASIAGPDAARAAYHWSTEVSAYVAPAARRRGVGRLLYDALLPQLADRGLCNAYAGIALPSDASVALRRSAGFRTIGVLPAVGRKFGRWHERLVVSAAPPRAAAQCIHHA